MLFDYFCFLSLKETKFKFKLMMLKRGKNHWLQGTLIQVNQLTILSERKLLDTCFKLP